MELETSEFGSWLYHLLPMLGSNLFWTSMSSRIKFEKYYLPWRVTVKITNNIHKALSGYTVNDQQMVPILFIFNFSKMWYNYIFKNKSKRT